MRRFSSRYGFTMDPREQALPGAPMIIEGQVFPALEPQIQIEQTLSPDQAIVMAQTPQELAEAATVPVIRNDALVYPDSIPPAPTATSTGPATFPDYTIQPELLGAPTSKYVPGMYDQRTLTSLFPSLIRSAPLDEVPAFMMEPALPPPPPPPVIDIFNTMASRTIDQAIEMDYAASVQTSIANDLQRKADEAAFDATRAIATATMDPTFNAQASAASAVAIAEDSQYLADRARAKAGIINQSADDKAAEAAVATKQIEDAAANEQAAYNESVAISDTYALDTAINTPGLEWENMVPPELSQPVTVPGFSVSPLMAGGVLGVVGYLLGGPRGGAVGALIGGAGAYFMRPRQQSGSVAEQFVPGFAPDAQEQQGYLDEVAWKQAQEWDAQRAASGQQPMYMDLFLQSHPGWQG